MAHYYIFKTDYLTGTTTHICNGSHDSEEECRLHWQAYMYGFLDAATEIYGGLSFGCQQGFRKLSFRMTHADEKAVEYFMLLDEEGSDLVQKLSLNTAITE